MPFILVLSLYLKLFRSVIEHDNLTITDRNLTKVEWDKLVNHPFNEYEW
jgi:hypothetical protein